MTGLQPQMYDTAVKVLDGGLATELVRMGYEDIDDDPLWSARLLNDDPDAIEKVHLSFLEAGADVITTASYQASVDGFVKHLHVTDATARSLIKKSVLLAKNARQKFLSLPENKGKPAPLVAGSVGPYGACLHDGSEYTGSYVDTVSAKDLTLWHRERINLLVEAGADLLAFESIPAKIEAEVLVTLLEETPSVKAWLTFTCKDGHCTSHGEPILDAASVALKSDQVFGVGVNCTSPLHIESLLQKLSCLKDKKTIIVYPNSGETWTRDYKWEKSTKIESLDRYVHTWLKNGASWIGGCCRTTPADIQKIRSEIVTCSPKDMVPT